MEENSKFLFLILIIKIFLEIPFYINIKEENSFKYHIHLEATQDLPVENYLYLKGVVAKFIEHLHDLKKKLKEVL